MEMRYVVLVYQEKIVKQRRRKRQQERQKGNRFWLAKQQLCTCITPFLYISLPSLRDYNVNFLISGFMEDENIRQRFSFFFLWTWIQSFRIQLLKKISSFWQMKNVGIWAMKSLLLTLPNICRLLLSSRKFVILLLQTVSRNYPKTLHAHTESF